MSKFIVGTLIGGLVAYAGHRVVMNTADTFLKFNKKEEKKD